MLEMAEVKASDVVYDLGSGDGRIPILAAKRFGARGVGIEIDNALVRIARENVRQAGVASRVRIDAGDALTADLSPATVIVLYLLPETLPRLRPVIENLRRPVRVISHDAPVEGWTPTVTESIPGASGRVHLLYRYDLNRYRER
jgi:predicted RNA methylase